MISEKIVEQWDLSGAPDGDEVESLRHRLQAVDDELIAAAEALVRVIGDDTSVDTSDLSLAELVGEVEHQISRLRAEIDEMRKQRATMNGHEMLAMKAPITFEVACKAWGDDPNFCDDHTRKCFFAVWSLLCFEWAEAMVEHEQSLKVTPGAQTAPSVPAPIEGAKYMSNDWYYAEGWNDCRHAMLDAQTAPSVPDGWQPIETAPKDGTHVLLANKSGTRVADGMYGNYGVWSWPYVMVEPAYWRPIPAAPGAQENNDG